jgi:hypothetical protein
VSNNFQPVCSSAGEQESHVVRAVLLTHRRSENRYALIAEASLSVILVKLVYGNTGK